MSLLIQELLNLADSEITSSYLLSAFLLSDFPIAALSIPADQDLMDP